jgi:peptidoglycan/LPS O-acetylase OafA/YrhL
MSKTPKILLAFLLGLLSFPLLFLLGEGIKIPSNIPAAEAIHVAIFLIVIGAYFFLFEYLLTRRDPKPASKQWPITVALTATLIVTALITVAVEPNRSAVLATVGTAILAVACSWAGAAVTERSARH